MAQRATIRLALSAVGAAIGDFGPGPTAEVLTDQFWPEGTSGNQADRLGFDDRSLAGSANEDIDLITDTSLTADGSALGLAEVRALVIKTPSTNGNNIEVKPGAATGWTALLADASDVIKVPPGSTYVFTCGTDGALPVAAGSKILNIANTDGSAATYTICVIGTSA